MRIIEQAALMRLGLRFIEEHGLGASWVGRIPTSEEIDEWEANQVRKAAEERAAERGKIALPPLKFRA